MYEIFMQNKALAIIAIAAGAALVIFLIVKALQKIGMEKIRGYVYKLFVSAEHEFEHGENAKKFEYVVMLAKSAIPAPFNFFITESLLRKVIQAWFDLCKDLLDDGKINKSVKE